MQPPGTDLGGPASPLAGLVGFTTALRRAGLACEATRTDAYLQAVQWLDPADPADLYWAGRLTLCAEPDDLPRYDEAFAAWFTPLRPAQSALTPVPQPKPVMIAALRADSSANADGERDELPQLRVAASDREVLRHRDIAALSKAEREHLRELIALLRIEPPRRRAMRYRPGGRDRLDPRRTLRALLANGGEPVRLNYARRGRRPRKLVLLIDVSGSMQPYADALLRFAHAVLRRSPAFTEVFTVGTRLTRLSRQLRHRDPEQALIAAAHAVPDFAGGTRLGDGMKAFLDRWGQRGIARQAIVVVFSDGWERGDPALLGEQMRRLRRLAKAVFWVNPHAGHAGYRPVQSGVAAAMPYVDSLLAGHSLDTLEILLREIRDA
ncbi:MAG TPA: VWA domain-containing protein [Pseudonocardiaceae bacterium]|nr:VWA domain-containing protein [Pseudonocardiaceae bacterium]